MLQRKKPLKAKKGFNQPDLETLKKSGLVRRASTLGAPRKPMRARSERNPGWWNWALENVWAKREHKCEVCDMPIPGPQPINFSHLLPRNTYRRYKLDERNVRIKCGQCHNLWHDTPRDELTHPVTKNFMAWRRMFALADELKKEANGILKG